MSIASPWSCAWRWKRSRHGNPTHALNPDPFPRRKEIENVVRDGAEAVSSAPKGGLTDAARRWGLRVLLATTFLTWGGFFAVIPLISIHYVDGLGWAASSIGLALAIRQFVQQGSTVISGALADRLGAKGLIAAGMVLRGVS